MSKQLIINADDYGLHPQINEGIIRCLQAGTVQSLSMVANSEYFSGSVNQLKAFPDVSLGVHLNLTDGEPLSPRSNLSFLLNPGKRLPGNHWTVIRRILRNRRKTYPIEEEFDRQIQRMKSVTPAITHIDSHGHIHMLPVLFPIVTRLARKYQIPYIRVSLEPLRLSDMLGNIKALGLNACGRKAKQFLSGQSTRTSDYFFGIRYAGRMTTDKIAEIAAALQPGLTELAVHPGVYSPELEKAFPWKYEWQKETAALTDPDLKGIFSEHNILLARHAGLQWRR